MITRYSIGGAGAGASPIRRVSAYIASGTTGGNAPPDTAGAWQQLAAVGELAIPASTGDWVQITAGFLARDASLTHYELAILVGSSLVWYASSGSATPGFEGDPVNVPQPGVYRGREVSGGLVVQAGHLDDGAVRFALAVQSGGAGLTFYSGAYPFRWRAANYGPPAA